MVSAIDSIRGSIPNSTDPNAGTKPGDLNKMDFLNLLVSQLQHQDPMNPEDPSEFTAQLTQYSSLEQLINLNSGLTGLGESQFLNSQIAAASFVGKDAVVGGDDLILAGGAAAPVQYQLGEASAATTMNIYNDAGALVKTVELGTATAGTHNVTWDGTTTAGTAALDGNYRFEVVAKDATGKPITASTAFTGRVTGVTYENGSIGLKINGTTYNISSLISVDQPAAA